MHKDRKKEHKKVIKYMRRMNKNLLEDDYVGCGRFRLDLWSESWYRFEDGSGGELFLTFKITDTATGNKALFFANNYNYYIKIWEYCNDFLIRCSSGCLGHIPSLNYIAYDVHSIKQYVGDIKNGRVLRQPEEYVIDKYCWIGKEENW